MPHTEAADTITPTATPDAPPAAPGWVDARRAGGVKTRRMNPGALVLFKPKGERAKGRAARWHFKFHGGDGHWVYRIGHTDRAATMEVGRAQHADAFKKLRLFTDVRAERLSGQARIPLSAHREQYLEHLEGLGRAPAHVKTIRAYLERVAKGLGWMSLSEIRADEQAHQGGGGELLQSILRHLAGMTAEQLAAAAKTLGVH